jgi:hypothetical protein
MLHQALRCVVVVVLQAVFMADNLSIQLIDQLIHCGVQVRVRAFGEHVAAFDMDIAFRSLASLFFFLVFYCEQDFDINHLVKMSHDPI